jgi:hypothetical protein
MPGSEPLAAVYSGHQFGVWAGQLGDGRAHLLGEIAAAGSGWEIQLKGAGQTPYSRFADGRAVLRSSIREFLCSEAMAALGVPTTRALCVVGSNAPVRRETVETAAVVTRLAPSFIRFGSFEHWAARNKAAELRQLADYVIDRFRPACRDAANPYDALLRDVGRRTGELIARWQAVGFMHGVMNTDNMSILGLTLDYGPFGFMDAFDAGHICNHSDERGRYSYRAQPQIGHWNLYALGQALASLIGEPDAVQAAIEESYVPAFEDISSRRSAPSSASPAAARRRGLHRRDLRAAPAPPPRLHAVLPQPGPAVGQAATAPAADARCATSSSTARPPTPGSPCGAPASPPRAGRTPSGRPRWTRSTRATCCATGSPNPPSGPPRQAISARWRRCGPACRSPSRCSPTTSASPPRRRTGPPGSR